LYETPLGRNSGKVERRTLQGRPISIESGGSNMDDVTLYLILKHNTKRLILLFLLRHMF